MNLVLDISEFLATHGPCTGAELLALTGWEVFTLWKACRTQPGIIMQRVGRRFLRLDKEVAGYARLSPSIRREFLTYTVVGRAEQEEQTAARGLELQREFVRISQYKRQVAHDAVRRVVESSPSRERLMTHVCAMIAGDVVYGMAHTVERPEPSTGRLVRGSDLDIVIVADEEATPEEHEALDSALHREKWHMLALPELREELDYIVKDIAKVMAQLQFDDFRHKVACKILHEGEFLYGSAELCVRLKRLVSEFGIPQRLAHLEAQAIQQREVAETQLAECPEMEHDPTWQHLFFTSEEREEIY